MQGLMVWWLISENSIHGWLPETHPTPEPGPQEWYLSIL
jgi:hypothetical protein